MEKIIGKKIPNFKLSVHRVKKDLVSWASYNEISLLAMSFDYFINNRCLTNKNKKLYKEGYIKGQPDFFIPIPSNEYNGLFVYLKINKDYLERNAHRIIQVLEQQKYKVIIAKSFDDAIEQIMDYLDFI